jgi:hypothetical protein
MKSLVKSLIKNVPVQLNLKRNIFLSGLTRANNIFNIQDEADFKKRVLENSKPVIVDFHATYDAILIYKIFNYC